MSVRERERKENSVMMKFNHPSREKKAKNKIYGLLSVKEAQQKDNEGPLSACKRERKDNSAVIKGRDVEDHFL